MDRPRLSILIRWIVAGLIAATGVVLLARVITIEGNWTAAFGKSLFGIAGIITGVLLVSPELVRLAVSPISRLIDSVLLPSEQVTPPADLKLAHFYNQNGRYDEACDEYERILQYHPDLADAYLEGIRAAALAGDEKRAAKFHHRAQRALRVPEQRDLLEAVYAARNESAETTGDIPPEPDALPDASPEPEPDPK